MRAYIFPAALMLIFLVSLIEESGESNPLNNHNQEYRQRRPAGLDLGWMKMQSLSVSEGGLLANLWNSRYVLRGDASTYIIDMRPASLTAALCLTLFLIFFTPAGSVLFRGRIHVLVGTALEKVDIAADPGRGFRILGTYRLRHGATSRQAYRQFMMHDFRSCLRIHLDVLAYIASGGLILVILMHWLGLLPMHRPNHLIVASIVHITVLCMLAISAWYDNGNAGASTATPSRPHSTMTEHEAECAVSGRAGNARRTSGGQPRRKAGQ